MTEQLAPHLTAPHVTAPHVTAPHLAPAGSTSLAPMRHQLDELDRQIVELVGARLAICAEVAAIKRREGIPMMQPDRVQQVRERYAELGARIGADPNFMRALAGTIIDEACRLEDMIIDSEIIDGEPTGSAAC